MGWSSSSGYGIYLRLLMTSLRRQVTNALSFTLSMPSTHAKLPNPPTKSSRMGPSTAHKTLWLSSGFLDSRTPEQTHLLKRSLV
jgi:hypothetical protein